MRRIIVLAAFICGAAVGAAAIESFTTSLSAQGDPRAGRWQFQQNQKTDLSGGYLLDTASGELWTIVLDLADSSETLMIIPKTRQTPAQRAQELLQGAPRR